jgi:fumarate hydratase subunit beta
MEYSLKTPIAPKQLAALRAGDDVLLSGEIYTARDAAHKRIYEALQQGGPLPFALEEATIYYAGPTPAMPGHVIGSIGPTTAGRMDSYTPLLLQHGLAAMIGKGARSAEVVEAMRQQGAVYFGFIGGLGALAAAHITACEPVAYEDLGSEAVRKLVVEEFPLTVLVDSTGASWYEEGPQAYLKGAADRA